MTIQELNHELGNIDIYLLDQILKGKYNETTRILDAGCGEGRNIIWFIRNNYSVYGIDQNPSAIQMLQYISRSINPSLPKENFLVGNVEDLPFPDSFFDGLICSAVLHFAKNEAHFLIMFEKMVKVVKPGGSLFIRMASNIGAEDTLTASTQNQVRLPDGTMRFLLTRTLLETLLKVYNLRQTEPTKTVNVQDKRFMTTLMLAKGAEFAHGNS